MTHDSLEIPSLSKGKITIEVISDKKKTLEVSTFDWYRVDLDEAHTIKSWKTLGAQAAFALSAHCRWCLTGTLLQFAQHIKLIGDLLEQLKTTELKRYPKTREPLEHLEDALMRSYIFVKSCQDRSYLYLLAMGWNIAYQFCRAQNEIDQYLKIIPLITLVDNA
ncbi:hypothetical protein CQW23_01239 [Capsicum baccatum]|uniref:MCAfunc domain-containing protein n=1 Tax=Capsicum baccatum TaxID=33114 RepID=A0A2G2XMZ8_CAPBA|nr:hypothetical protein CQW23_01239 [Capsicum baccatum]